MRIAIFDYLVTRNNPTGGCHLRLLRALAHEHEFTVFSVAFDNPCPERIRWVRIPAPVRPLALLFLAFHLLAPLWYCLYRLRTGARFDLLQKVESNLSFGTIAYTHFCHTAFLRQHWGKTRSRGLRGAFQWLDHRLHAWLEGLSYRSAEQVVVPSRGLANELQGEFPSLAGKLQVIPNAIDVRQLEQPWHFDRSNFRRQLGIATKDSVFVFVALGQFERKGLPLLLDALAALDEKHAKVLVVGGNPDLIASYQRSVTERALEERVIFAGMQSDVRPYLWAADAFVFPSLYETFSLVAYEAAAASLPLITPLLYGIDEIVLSGATGYCIERTAESLTSALAAFLSLAPESKRAMGERARAAVLAYDEEQFVHRWTRLYRNFEFGSRAVDCRPVSVPGRHLNDNPDGP